MTKEQLLKKISGDFRAAKKTLDPIVKRLRRAKLIKADKPSRDYVKKAQWWLAYFVQYHVPDSPDGDRVKAITDMLNDAGFQIGVPIRNTVGGLYKKQFGNVNVVAELHFTEHQDPSKADPTFLEITYTYLIQRDQIDQWNLLASEIGSDAFLKLLRKL